MIAVPAAALGAVAVLVLPGLTACGPTVGDTPTAGRCRVKFAAPYRPTLTSSQLLRGQASARCTGPVDAHHVTLYLERNTGATWASRDQDSSDAIPYPNGVDLTVIVECRPGTWRLRYDLTATAAGKSAHAGDASDQLTLKTQQDCAKPQMTDTPTIRIEVRITGDGNDRLRIFQAPANTTDAGALMARIGATLPEFDTVEWVTGYLPETPQPNPEPE